MVKDFGAECSVLFSLHHRLSPRDKGPRLGFAAGLGMRAQPGCPHFKGRPLTSSGGQGAQSLQASQRSPCLR